MSISQKSFESFLTGSRETIFNAVVLEDIKFRMLNHGYTDEKFQEGQTLYANANDALEQWKTAYAEQLGATDEFCKARKEAFDFYGDILKMARFAVKDHKELREKLELDVRKSKTFGRWMPHAVRMYTKAKESEPALLLLGEYNITLEKLDQGLQLINTVLEKKQVRDDRKGIAQVLTSRKGEAWTTLRVWMVAFRTACRIEFKDEPQTLERLGIQVYSEGYVSAKTRKKNEENALKEAKTNAGTAPKEVVAIGSGDSENVQRVNQ